MLSSEKDFDKQLTEISEVYERIKNKALVIGFPGAYTAKEVKTASDKFYEDLARLRDIACVNLRAKHDIEQN